jgi:hypothetical protein
MADQKDRFGDQIHDKEKIIEDQWARERDAELLAKLRTTTGTTFVCPKCGKALVEKTHAKVKMMACPDKDGAWLDEPVLEAILKR